MPIFGLHNLQQIRKLAEAFDLPTWLAKAIIVEYLPCRRFEGNTVVIDYGLVTTNQIKTLPKPYVILNGIALFHNVTKEVLHQRIVSGFAGFPMANLAKQEAFYQPEGKVSPHYLPNPIRNGDEVEGDWKLGLHLFNKAVVVDEDGIYQWTVTTNALISADVSQQWYESDLFSRDDLEELRRIHQAYQRIDQSGLSPEQMQNRLKKLYDGLELLHCRMRETVLIYHQQAKNESQAREGYTEDSPPQLTLFDEFTILKDKDTKKRRIKVRSHVEHAFFRAAYRAASRAREVRKNIDAGEIYPVPIAEEIEAAVESMALSVMCLEAYINGFIQDHFEEGASYVKRMELTAKWLLVPGLLGKADCFKPGSQPFDNFKQLITWRNDELVHYKHEFRFPVPLGTLGKVSKLYSICNADNSEQAIKTVRDMIRQLNTSLGFTPPSWIREDVSIESWMKAAIHKSYPSRSEPQTEDDVHLRMNMEVRVIPQDP